MTVQVDPRPIPATPIAPRYDVMILGAGLAGLSLARHLLLDSDKTVLLVDRRPSVPSRRQKVGEATVQVSGYYFSKVLDLEEHLLREHYMKYNLRFLWRARERDGRAYEDYSQSYIRPFSNIPSYQIDRNLFEAELLARNLADPRFSLASGTRRLRVDLAADGGPHRVGFERQVDGEAEGRDADKVSVEATWVVDASGRNKVLAKKLDLERPSPIRHGAAFAWVEGAIDLERLTDRSRRAVRVDPARADIGHLPVWLATNHFAGEGFWLWVIPLHGKTSLGLVYDRAVIDPKEVSSPDKLVAWILEHFPLFERTLPGRRMLDFAGFRDFAYDCGRTLHPARWAMTGEAGRFSDPLYSPGGDLIAVHNTLIVDAIRTDDQAELDAKARRYEALMRAVYEAYVPSYAVSYQALGDQEVYSLKYVWELTIYFGFYVFPFINDLLTDRRFVTSYLRAFARLGPLNHALQALFADYYQWKKAEGVRGTDEPAYFDFTSAPPLARAEKTFYEIGVSVERARQVLRGQVANVEELARFLVVAIAARVLGVPEAIHHAAFVERFDAPDALVFDPAAWRQGWRQTRGDDRRHAWSFAPDALAPLQPDPLSADASHPDAPRNEQVRA